MTVRGVIRRMFPGGNTSRGFVSFFEFIVPPINSYTFVLKGGPGTGKSTFMNRIAADMLARGIDAEYHHCSADPGSVDGIAFPALGVAVVDGTAPHALEPIQYEASGEVVDLGQFCDRPAIRRQQARIATLRGEARAAFARAYRYLAAAREVREDWTAVNKSRRDERRLRLETSRLIASIFGSDTAVDPHPSDHRSVPAVDPCPPGAEPDLRWGPWPSGFQRRLFAGSITPDGPRHHLGTLMDALPHKFVLTGDPGTGRSNLLSAVADAARASGYVAELFHCPFDPEDIDHIIIPALGTAVISSVRPHEYRPLSERPDVRRSHLVCNLDDEGPENPHVATARQLFGQLFRHAISALQDARSAHMQLEACYVPHMDFDGLERLREQVRNRIMAMSE